jgi:hypothetical protein
MFAWSLLKMSTCPQIYKLNTQVQGHFIKESILYKNMYFYITDIFYIQSFSIKLANSFKTIYLQEIGHLKKLYCSVG